MQHSNSTDSYIKRWQYSHCCKWWCYDMAMGSCKVDRCLRQFSRQHYQKVANSSLLSWLTLPWLPWYGNGTLCSSDRGNRAIRQTAVWKNSNCSHCHNWPWFCSEQQQMQFEDLWWCLRVDFARVAKNSSVLWPIEVIYVQTYCTTAILFS